MKRKTISNSFSKAEKQAFIREFLTSIFGEGMPEHDSPFKLYFNDKLIGSATPSTDIKSTKQTDNGNEQ